MVSRAIPYFLARRCYPNPFKKFRILFMNDANTGAFRIDIPTRCGYQITMFWARRFFMYILSRHKNFHRLIVTIIFDFKALKSFFNAIYFPIRRVENSASFR